MSAQHTPGRKLSAAQQRFLSIVDGTAYGLACNRRERDGTVVPYRSESRTVESLVRIGLLKWTSAGSDGFIYSGVASAAIAKATGGAS